MKIELGMACPACEHLWQAPFEAISYVWVEIERWVERLLQTIHLLASSYGWSEQAILAMSAWRRQRYVEMIG
jgi:hypothetical protein